MQTHITSLEINTQCFQESHGLGFSDVDSDLHPKHCDLGLSNYFLATKKNCSSEFKVQLNKCDGG